MQASIDSCKRRFDVDITNEIRRIKKDMNIKEHKYPAFWQLIKKGFNKNNINPDLHCPMNSLYNLDLLEFHNTSSTLPMSYFFVKYPIEKKDMKKKSKKVENLIAKFSLKIYGNNTNLSQDEKEYFVLRKDFNDLINEILKINISSNYVGLFSWLIDRAFLITNQQIVNKNTCSSQTAKNKVLLIKVLYQVNSKNLLKIFSKNL